MLRNISYSFAAFHHDQELINGAMRALNGVVFDTMIGTGLSGALVIPILARAMSKRFAIVRKPTDSTHSHSDFEGEIGTRWLFVDDFVASGETRSRVRNTVDRIANRNAVELFYVGTYTYEHQEFVSY